MMNVHAPSFFVPPRPEAPSEELGLYRFFVAVRTNALQIWPKSAYEQGVVVRSALGRTRILINAPDAIHRDVREGYVSAEAARRDYGVDAAEPTPAP